MKILISLAASPTVLEFSSEPFVAKETFTVEDNEHTDTVKAGQAFFLQKLKGNRYALITLYDRQPWRFAIKAADYLKYKALGTKDTNDKAIQKILDLEGKNRRLIKLYAPDITDAFISVLKQLQKYKNSKSDFFLSVLVGDRRLRVPMDFKTATSVDLGSFRGSIYRRNAGRTIKPILEWSDMDINSLRTIKPRWMPYVQSKAVAHNLGWYSDQPLTIKVH